MSILFLNEYTTQVKIKSDLEAVTYIILEGNIGGIHEHQFKQQKKAESKSI